MIRIKKLNLEFPRRFKLSIDELDVEKGRTLAILGPNGAGKSTLLNIIALLQKPDSGSIEVDFSPSLRGRTVVRPKQSQQYRLLYPSLRSGFAMTTWKRLLCQHFVPPRNNDCDTSAMTENGFSQQSHNRFHLRRKMSVVFPCPYLLNDTVYENVALPLRIRGCYNAGKIKETLSFFKITDLKDYRANTLSQGQMRRVALARALVSDPELLLLDEPFLSLDRCYKAALCGDLCDILKRRRTTTLLVTQDHYEALRLADRVAVMKDGRILRQGAPREIFTTPVSKDVAGFLQAERSRDAKFRVSTD